MRGTPCEEMEKRAKVLIIGHSFISRLEMLLGQSELFPADFNLARCEIRCYRISGGRAQSLLRDQDLQDCIIFFKPVLILLRLGGIDIC